MCMHAAHVETNFAVLYWDPKPQPLRLAKEQGFQFPGIDLFLCYPNIYFFYKLISSFRTPLLLLFHISILME